MKSIVYIITVLLCFSVTCVNASNSSWGKKKKKKAGTEKVESSDSTSKAASTSEYEKFMKDAVVKKGMFNVIKKKDKIYLEIPDRRVTVSLVSLVHFRRLFAHVIQMRKMDIHLILIA